MIKKIQSLLGAEADDLLNHKCTGFPKESLHLPGPDFIDRVWVMSDRSPAVLRSLASLFGHGRLAGTGYLSILPVDQGVEHSAAASFAPNPIYFDPENIVKLAMEGGCNAVASTLGVLGSVARKYAHKIPFILKINHNEMLTYPNFYDQTLFASVEQAFDLGAVAVGATIYFGSPECRRQILEISEAFKLAHELGMACILWCYLRNPAFKTKEGDFHASADLTGQANHLGVTIEADIIKQKMADEQRRLQGRQVRQDQRPGLQQAGPGPPHRPLPLPGGQLLHGPGRADQLRRRLRQERPGRRGAHRGDQQAGRGHGPDLRAQDLPAPHERRGGTLPRHPGRLPL